MARKRTLLTDEQWARIAALLPRQDMSRGGRPRADDRRALEGILWIAKTGAQWYALPSEYPCATTCWRRLRRWQREGVWEKIRDALLAELDRRGGVQWDECFADATFAPAKKGATKSAQPARAKGPS